jgi:hypothetical protein
MLWFNFILPIVKDPDCNVKRRWTRGKSGQTERLMFRKVDRQIDGPISRKTTDKKMDRGTDGQTVRKKSF